MYTYIYIYLHVYMYVCMYVCMYVYIYIYMYIFTHTCMYYIYIYTINQYAIYENIHLHSVTLANVFGGGKEGWGVGEEEARVRRVCWDSKKKSSADVRRRPQTSAYVRIREHEIHLRLVCRLIRQTGGRRAAEEGEVQ